MWGNILKLNDLMKLYLSIMKRKYVLGKQILQNALYPISHPMKWLFE